MTALPMLPTWLPVARDSQKDLDASLRPIFKRLVKLLQERRVLTAGDAELIRLYCFLYDRHVRNAALLRQEGELCTYIRLDSNGTPHPQVKTNLRLKVSADCERQMASILNQLGLTPTAKDRAKPAKGDHEPESIAGTVGWMILHGGQESSPPQVSPDEMAAEDSDPALGF